MILITGGNGFLGKALAEKLAANASVLCIGRSSKNSKQTGSISTLSADVTDLAAVKKIFQEFPIETVLHLAGPTTHHELVHEKNESLYVNWLGTYNLLSEFLNKDSAKRFVYSSSGKVYSPMKKNFLSETSEAEPSSILGKNKRAVEMLIEFMSAGAPSTKSFAITRIFNVFGPHQKESFLVPTIIQQLKRSPTLNLGNLSDRRDYIYLDDVISAMELITHNTTPGLQYYNVGSGQDYSAQDILDAIQKLTQKNITTNIDKTKLRTDETATERSDISKLKSLGWQPRYSLEQGLKKYIETDAPELLK